MVVPGSSGGANNRRGLGQGAINIDSNGRSRIAGKGNEG